VSLELPIPAPNPDSHAYWEAAKDEKLVIRRCSSCSAFHFMPRHLCPHCWSTDLEWVQASGKGTVHSYSIIRRAPMQSYSPRVPYVVALIDLDEGPRMFANIVGEGALEAQVGSRVSVCFETRGDFKLPQFTLQNR
jgi:uncharacterized OB-fold protein